MSRAKPWSTLLLLPLLAWVPACDDDDGEDDDDAECDNADGPADGGEEEGEIEAVLDCESLAGEEVPIDEAKLYVEYNFTDGDLGVHGLFDTTGWSLLCVYAPDGQQVLGVQPSAGLGDLTMAGIFFESREPELDEFGFPELVADFPEGAYTVRALAYDGRIYAGAASFTHDVPAPPEVIAPAIIEDEEDAAETTVPVEGLVVQWAEVTETTEGNPVDITGYEIIVTNEDSEDPNGFARPIISIHVPLDRREVAIPEAFLEADTLYELEVLALEVSGNQTITVGFFRTE